MKQRKYIVGAYNSDNKLIYKKEGITRQEMPALKRDIDKLNAQFPAKHFKLLSIK